MDLRRLPFVESQNDDPSSSAFLLGVFSPIDRDYRLFADARGGKTQAKAENRSSETRSETRRVFLGRLSRRMFSERGVLSSVTSANLPRSDARRMQLRAIAQARHTEETLVKSLLLSKRL